MNCNKNTSSQYNAALPSRVHGAEGRQSSDCRSKILTLLPAPPFDNLKTGKTVGEPVLPNITEFFRGNYYFLSLLSQ